MIVLGRFSPAAYAASALRQTLLGPLTGQIAIDHASYGKPTCKMPHYPDAEQLLTRSHMQYAPRIWYNNVQSHADQPSGADVDTCMSRAARAF